MGRKIGRLQPKSKELMKEVSDIVKNAEDDEAALAFLQDTLEDDFPDLELGSMDLHEATKVLGGSDSKASEVSKLKMMENLNESLGNFMKKQDKSKRKKPKRKRRTRRKRR